MGATFVAPCTSPLAPTRQVRSHERGTTGVQPLTFAHMYVGCPGHVAESKRHKAIRFYKEMQRLERTVRFYIALVPLHATVLSVIFRRCDGQWFTRVLVVTDLDDPLTDDTGDSMPLSPDTSRSRQSKGTNPPLSRLPPHSWPLFTVRSHSQALSL